MESANDTPARPHLSPYPPLRLEVAGLGIRRGGRMLFDGLSFGAGAGAFVEVLGRNGAGKTSLLRALAGFIEPAFGSIALYGNTGPLDGDARAAATHALGHRDGLKPGLDARTHLRFWIGLLGGDGGKQAAALARVGLGPIADLPGRALSAGQGRRLALARLLACPRPLWLLDEPAAALDHLGKALVADLIEEHRAAGGLVVAAVHEPLGPAPSFTVRLGAAA